MTRFIFALLCIPLFAFAQDSLNVRRIGSVELPLGARGLAVNGTHAFLGSTPGLVVVDISDPARPVRVGQCVFPWWSGSFDTPSYAHRVSVEGEYVFRDSYGGIWILDVADPSNPREIGFHDSPGEANHAFVRDNLAYLADVTYFSIYDISAALPTPENPNPNITQFSLHPIYPNPFNNTANISFDLPRAVTGRLVVYDVLGRMTSTLYDGRLAAGTHQLQFNGSTLSSGTYFVQLEVPEFTATQKAVLLK